MAASVLCRNACGRECGKGADGRVFTTCCKSCAFLKEKHGYCGHDIDCDIRANDAVCPPWYWKAAAEWPGSFHEEVGGEYVKEMGTKILRRRLPEWRVLRCERIEVRRKPRIRERGVRKADIQPETAESIQFSANTTLDHGVNEVWLLHGTSEEAAKGCFGTGVYFADDAKKSNQYAKGRTEDNCKIMLLCRVILGNVMVLPKGQDRTADRFAEDPHVARLRRTRLWCKTRGRDETGSKTRGRDETGRDWMVDTRLGVRADHTKIGGKTLAGRDWTWAERLGTRKTHGRGETGRAPSGSACAGSIFSVNIIQVNTLRIRT
ncbi:unnamed protein product [Effrenium voratum]|uniref:PARP catalytic domain-containing protein n=1 Tax=Effrenium voratum TaxID=2562239 RepID=A0AA36J726_9DINO|nr:unnamed protein product [Effrenium voratum]